MLSTIQTLVRAALLTYGVAICSVTALAQPAQVSKPQVIIDEDVLATFVDEPCRHFERARDCLLKKDRQGTANHLRIGAAFLKLQEARAVAQGKKLLSASIHELEQLAVVVENKRLPKVEDLQQAFARAHYALAGHHCIKSAHRCCRTSSDVDKKELRRAGQDLKAAGVHLKLGSLWEGTEPDAKTRAALSDTWGSANDLMLGAPGSQNRASRIIGKLRERLENVTGRKIGVAPVPTTGSFGRAIPR